MATMPETSERSRKASLLIRLSEDERAMLQAIAEERGLSLSDTFRQLVREDAARRGLLRQRKSRKGPS